METAYRKSSYSFANGNCAEVASGWRTPSRSMNNGNCAQARTGPGTVLVRDTKQAGQPGRTVLAFTADAWRAFTAGLKDAR